MTEIEQLVKWLKDNSAGVYRPAQMAANRLEELYEYVKAHSPCMTCEHDCYCNQREECACLIEWKKLISE
jgi:hypothetical protein